MYWIMNAKAFSPNTFLLGYPYTLPYVISQVSSHSMLHHYHLHVLPCTNPDINMQSLHLF